MSIINEYEIIDGSIILIVTEYDDGSVIITQKD